MTRPLSLDLRQRVVGAIDAGQSCRAAAARFGIAPSVAVKWHRRWRETGSVAPRAQGGDKRSSRIEALGPAIFAMVEAAVHITLAEIAERLEAEHGERFAPSTCTTTRRGSRARSAATARAATRSSTDEWPRA